MAQKTEELIWTAIKDRLEAAQAVGQKLEYVKNVLEGMQSFTEGAIPCVVMEPNSDEEAPHTTGRKIRLKDRIDLHCLVQSTDVKNAIIGIDPKKGIKDLVGDVKDVLNAIPIKLGLAAEGVNWIRFPSVVYIPLVETYPDREAVITVEVDATLTETQR